jgi:YaaC-like Protein
VADPRARRVALSQTEILTKNPWEAIESAINVKMDRRSKKLDVCLSFLYQARDFYIAYGTARPASRPLLLYYAFLNLAKTFIVYRNVASDLGNATHGLTEDRTRYSQAIITARPDRRKGKEIYDLFSQALGNQLLNREVRYRLSTVLLPQIVIGHRLWTQAANKNERFIRAERIMFLHNPDDKAVWRLEQRVPTTYSTEASQACINYQGFLEVVCGA